MNGEEQELESLHDESYGHWDVREISRLLHERDILRVDATRYAFAKTMEGQVVTMTVFRNYGAAHLDEAIDSAMAADALKGKS